MGEIVSHNYILTPGRYVGAEDIEDEDESFDKKMQRLISSLREQQIEATKLDTLIKHSLAGLGYG